MMYTCITPIHEFNGIWVKREDLAYWDGLEYPSGSKVRQYLNMAHRAVQREGFPPCIVGCSANSAQQIYVAATAKQLNTQGIIYTAKRNIRTSATEYCASMGAEINEVKPAYLSYIRIQARKRTATLKHYVEWDRDGAIEDTLKQVVDLPKDIERIVVATGSGLTAEGIITALQALDLNIPVLIVKTSNMKIKFRAPVCFYSGINIIEPRLPYDTPVLARLPDGTPLDPFYAAKAWKYVEPGDLFWPPGLRPVISMPEACRDAFKDWKGPS